MVIKLIYTLITFLQIADQPQIYGSYSKCFESCLYGEKITLLQNSGYYKSYFGERFGGGRGIRMGYWEQKEDTILLVETSKKNEMKKTKYISMAFDDLTFLISSEEANEWSRTKIKIDSIFSNSEDMDMLSHARFTDSEIKKQIYHKTKVEILSTFLYPSKSERDIYIKIYEKK